MSRKASRAPQVGERVTFTGLTGRADLNDQQGEVTTWSEERGRFGVRVDGSSEIVAVKSSNLDTTLDRVGRTWCETIDAADDTPPITQHVLVEGKVVAGDLGFLPLRMLEARQGGTLASMVNFASAHFPAEEVGGLVKNAIEGEMNAIKELYGRFDKSQQDQRTAAVTAVYRVLFPILALIHAQGVAKDGAGILAVEAAGTLNQVLGGITGARAWVPVTATFLTHKQSQHWFTEAIRGGVGAAKAREHATQQVRTERRDIRVGGTARPCRCAHLATLRSLRTRSTGEAQPRRRRRRVGLLRDNRPAAYDRRQAQQPGFREDGGDLTWLDRAAFGAGYPFQLGRRRGRLRRLRRRRHRRGRKLRAARGPGGRQRLGRLRARQDGGGHHSGRLEQRRAR